MCQEAQFIEFRSSLSKELPLLLEDEGQANKHIQGKLEAGIDVCCDFNMFIKIPWWQ